MTTGDPRDMGNYMIDHKPFAGKDALGNIVDPDDIQGIKKWHEVDQSGVWEGDEWEPKPERDQCKLDEAYTLTEHDHFKINVGVVCAKLNDLLPKKNLAYGNSYVKVPSIMKVLYPNGIPLDKYDDALAIVRVMDKICRIVESNDPLGENPWFDIAGYGVLMSVIGGKNE